VSVGTWWRARVWRAYVIVISRAGVGRARRAKKCVRFHGRKTRRVSHAHEFDAEEQCARATTVYLQSRCARLLVLLSSSVCYTIITGRPFCSCRAHMTNGRTHPETYARTLCTAEARMQVRVQYLWWRKRRDERELHNIRWRYVYVCYERILCVYRVIAVTIVLGAYTTGTCTPNVVYVITSYRPRVFVLKRSRVRPRRRELLHSVLVADGGEEDRRNRLGSHDVVKSFGRVNVTVNAVV